MRSGLISEFMINNRDKDPINPKLQCEVNGFHGEKQGGLHEISFGGVSQDMDRPVKQPGPKSKL